MSTGYDIHADPIIQALVAEAEADPDAIGLVLTGSRGVGAVIHESDYDVVFVVTDEALDRYEAGSSAPSRGKTVQSPGTKLDLWHEAPRTLRLDTVVAWMLPAWAESQVIYDRTGQTTQLIESLRRIPEERARADAAAWYDSYLNALYRSLKAWRRGNDFGARMEAAGSVDGLLHMLFALERHWRPYNSRLYLHLDKLAGQGWQPGELRAILLDLITTGDPRAQQTVARRVDALLRERGLGHVYDSWEGEIDEVLEWTYENRKSDDGAAYT